MKSIERRRKSNTHRVQNTNLVGVINPAPKKKKINSRKKTHIQKTRKNLIRAKYLGRNLRGIFHPPRVGGILEGRGGWGDNSLGIEKKVEIQCKTEKVSYDCAEGQSHENEQCKGGQDESTRPEC